MRLMEDVRLIPVRKNVPPETPTIRLGAANIEIAGYPARPFSGNLKISAKSPIYVHRVRSLRLLGGYYWAAKCIDLRVPPLNFGITPIVEI